MAIYKVDGRAPQVGAAAFVADNATLAGDVTLAEESSVWYGAVLRADTGRITVGAGSNVQDNAVLHTGPGLDVVVGRNVSIGHSAVVHVCTVGDDCLIGMHATILNGAVIGAGSLVAAGALVTENAVIPAGSLVVGVPGKVVRTVSRNRKLLLRQTGRNTGIWPRCMPKRCLSRQAGIVRCCPRVYLKSPQRCSILLKSTSAALLILAIHPVLQRIRALQLLLFSEFSSTFDLSDTP